MTRYLEQRLKIRHLRVIDALEEHKSLLRASQALRVSQPALSRTLQEVEEIVGGELFERHPRGVRPNAMGLLIASRARTLLHTIREMETDLDALRDGQKRSIRVGVLPVAAHGLLPAVLAHANSEAAHLSIEVIEGRNDQLTPALLAGEIDVVLGRLYPPELPDELTRRVLYHEPISLIARADHPLFERATLTPADIQRYPIILPAVATRMERDVSDLLATIDLQPDRSIQSSSVGFMRELLLSGNYVSAIPRILVAGDLARDTLRILPIAMPPSERPAGMIYRGALSEAGTLLLSEVAGELARLAESDIVEIADSD